MAGWSILTDGSALDRAEVLRHLQSNGFCLDLDASLKGSVDSGCKDKLRCLFDQILSVFLKEISTGGDLRPLPLMLGDGRFVDLFKLFWVVRKKGGYDCVSKNRLWASVSEEVGLGSGVTSSVKLVYVKYLDTLARWLQRIFRNKGFTVGLSDCGGNLGLFSVELETESIVMPSQMSEEKKKEGDSIKLDSAKNEFHLLAAENTCNAPEIRSVIELDSDEKLADDEEDVILLDKSLVNEDSFSRKRKRESLSGMLNWVTEIAKNPGDPAIKMLPEWCGGSDSWMHALLAREALFLRRQIPSSSVQSLLQKKQKMHPSMYEDHSGGDNSTERLRCSERLLSLKKSHSLPCSKSSKSDLNMGLTPCMKVLENNTRDRQLLVSVGSLTANMEIGLHSDDYFQKQVSVGPMYQAEVPDWTGVASESDSKWLGTQIWPLGSGERISVIERDPIGKGRLDSCGCQFSGSVECIRFHIAEKRMRLKIELGSAFLRWRFNYMGEEVSLSWTEEEEKRFKAIVRLNPPSLDKCFWDQAFKSFPTKKRRDLVSYYFNVFVLRRRSYQNRVTPTNIDSDDDESDFGSLSNGFGHETVKVAGSKSVSCAQNKQCIDLEGRSYVG
ncbi:PREDICTED: AT-rich interactive domain-containing protein 2 [Nelumbo nucifera]|uniref:AT-rich interactive domain-containing protein 2 n=2 Tax=Nelumbo nucifera TaxID=4432 RepID=A0A1U8A119_NELNU|nr:PREDICTED: AT-rich interactive domain-containing protein 2 [Nelumbo nucifera]XP_010255293.1 PREDICTED: AT-rich interactive domain-containing protein 2 [Nelumbo nucifera]DAD18963.1 TPA_asm: hypothetical protein HUJ06_020426 [Nelumbo nucifera]